NSEVRHEIADQVISGASLDESWRKKLLLPYSESKPNLTPTLDRPFHVVSGYKLIQSFQNGDALIETKDGDLFVLDLPLATEDQSKTNLFLVKAGEKAFARAPGQYQHIDAFAVATLSKDQEAVLLKVVAAFENKAASLTRELAGFKAKQEFESSKARATDNNPYLQYVVARCYLEGTGTPKDDKQGLEWMKKAAGNGSGDAKTYLQNLSQSPH
ncbi:MAG TPA: hypothetical protein VHI52_04920, partial [Verrucomicrobiae bacterium]|nr:hypothetical protein [Verrucomicrobiae bacterium]